MKTELWTSEPVLYALADDTESHRNRLCVAEKRCPVRVEIVRGAIPEQLEDVLDGQLTLPCLIDKMLLVSGTPVISEYLEERYPDPPLLPDHPKLRAQVRHLVDMFRTWKMHTLLKNLQGFEDGIVGPWLTGPQYTRADIALAPMLWRLPDVSILGDSLGPRLKAYMDRLFSRPAFKQSLTEEEMLLPLFVPDERAW